jgi:hypothetical protein
MKRRTKSLVDPSLAAMASRLAALKRQAAAAGLWTDERELLACRKCGLVEDVTMSGELITCRLSALGHDTGLRFEPRAKNRFCCPACGKTVAIPSGGKSE